MLRFENKRVVVTGAASGIGRAVAERLLSEGAHVVLIDKSPLVKDVTSELAGKVEIGPSDVEYRQSDLADSASVREAIEYAARAGSGLDAVIHAAATSAGGTAVTISELDWHAVLDNALTSAFLIARWSIPQLAQNSGNLLMVSSQLGLVGTRNSVAYTAAKGGLINLTRSLALDHAEAGIRVNCLCPGPTDTPLMEASFRRAPSAGTARRDALSRVPLGRFGTPHEIASAAAFLSSDDASFVTGAALVVDGGYTAQ